MRSIASISLILAVVLHCTSMCLAAGFAPVVGVHSADSDVHQAPCHTPPSPVPDTSEDCDRCRDHIFLKTSSPFSEPHLAAEALWPLRRGDAGVAPAAPIQTGRHAPLALSPPRYLRLSILRC